MADMTREEFERQKNDAAERIRQIYRGQNMPSFPDFVAVPKTQKEDIAKVQKKGQKTAGNSTNNIFRFLNFSELLKSPDALLIMGLIFLLMSDNADEKLILALVFIMI